MGMHIADLTKHVPEGIKTVMDGTTITILLGVWAGVVSSLASFLTLIWMAIRIYETKTVQRWVGKKEDDEPCDKKDEEK